jgi:putative serine protease PepD
MRLPTRTAAIVAAAATFGAGGGAALYAVATDDGSTTTVVREVPVSSGQPAARSSGLTVHQIYERTYKGVVEINVTTAQSDSFPFSDQTQQVQGSGWVYDEQGHIITNQHVVDGAATISVKFWNGATYKATLVGTDPSTDLAVLKVDAPSSLLSPLTLGDSSAVQVGDGVVAIGSPFGLELTVTSGIVSALHREMTAPNRFTITDSIQTDAAINHGNSGGPLIDSAGRVIGVNAQIQSDSGGNEGVGFAIPSNTVRSIATQILASGKAEHAYLGVSLQTVPGSVAGRLGTSAGVEVTDVRSGTPAEGAGLESSTGSRTVDGQSYATGGDVIVAIDGTAIASAEELQSAIDAHRPGDKVTLTIMRHGKRRSVELKLGTRPA